MGPSRRSNIKRKPLKNAAEGLQEISLIPLCSTKVSSKEILKLLTLLEPRGGSCDVIQIKIKSVAYRADMWGKQGP